MCYHTELVISITDNQNFFKPVILFFVIFFFLTKKNILFNAIFKNSYFFKLYEINQLKF